MIRIMNKPTDEQVKYRRYNGPRTLDECCQDTIYGRDMVNEKYHGGESTWSFPENVKDRIEKDKRYCVWYDYTTPSDPSDTSIHYIVYYIEEYESNANHNKFDPSTLQPFDKVLLRDTKDDKWIPSFFGWRNYTEDGLTNGFSCANGAVFRYCIPYNDDTKHLIGTKQEADDFYHYWED